MRLLAIDLGSINAGVAAFEDEKCIATKRLRVGGPVAYRERLARTVGQLVAWLTEIWPASDTDMSRALARVDAVAMEGTALHRNAFRSNIKTLATMNFTQGYLLGALDQYLEGARFISIEPSRVKSAAGAPRARASALDHMQWTSAAAMGRADVPSVDEAAAFWIGETAIAQLREEALGKPDEFRGAGAAMT